MKVSSRRDVELPISTVFGEITDFASFEKRALKRGADVARTDPATGPGLGSVWDLAFVFRGRRRKMVAECTLYDPAEGLEIKSKSGGLDLLFDVSLVALSPRKTRMVVALELTPSNLSARLLVQSLRLAKASLKQRFAGALDEYASDLEREHHGVRPGMTLG